MHRSLAITSAAALLLVTWPPASQAIPDATPRLELPASWFSVVEPYRYVEARRFERGWNRGADVLVADGTVRAPVAGRVRFAGSVAGRPVVTIETRIDGLDVVVTLTGLDRRSVGEGDRVRRGAVVGTGRDVHVGMYDRARRSRYLPVVSAGAGGAGGSDGSADRAATQSSSPVADAVASRLLDAIRGDVEGGRPTADVVGAGVPRGAGRTDASSWTGAARPERRMNVGEASGPVLAAGPFAPVADDRFADVLALATPTMPPGVPGRAVEARSPWTIQPSLGGGGADGWGSEQRGRTIDDRRGVDAQERGAGTPVDAPTSMPMDPSGGRPHPGTAVRGPAGFGGADPHGTRIRSDGPAAGGARVVAIPIDDEVARTAEADRARSARTSDDEVEVDVIDTRWSIPAAFAALAAVLLLAIRVRRRTTPPTVTAISRPLAPILPTMHPRPARAVRTDGLSIVGGAPIAWPDTESGSTTHEPELLRHDADLLSERAAPPGPRVHDDRRGRDHPLPAAHGPGRVLPDGD